MVNSKLEAEVQSVCEAGFDSYLASKHREHLVEGMETGLLGAFIGTLLTIGASYVDPNKIIKPQHAWMPASIDATARRITDGLSAQRPGRRCIPRVR